MEIICIYLIENPDGKKYIGQTINFEKRIKSYKNGHCKSQIKLYRSFIKYGFINHKIKIIQECNKSNLDILEKYYIALYNSVKNGLNCKQGGNSRGELCDETKKRFSIAKLGNKNPNYNKTTWNKGIKQWANNDHPFLGKKLSNSHIENIKKSNPKIYAKGADNLRAVKINQYDLNNNFIKSFGSSQCIMRELNIDSSSVIKCCKGKLKTTKGFIFKYANNINIT